MTAALRRHGPMLAAALVVLSLAGVLATTALRGASAQEAVFNVFYFDTPVTASNGHATLDFQVLPEETIETASCTGNSPRSGGLIPAQVVTEVTSPTNVALRILHNDGRALTGTVQLNCQVGVISPAQPTSPQSRIKGNGAIHVVSSSR
jgi:hypothetical protein